MGNPYDALLGRLYANGAEVELRGGLNFASGFTVTPDAANNRNNITFDISTATFVDLEFGEGYIALGSDPPDSGQVRLSEGYADGITFLSSGLNYNGLSDGGSQDLYVGEFGTGGNIETNVEAKTYIYNTVGTSVGTRGRTRLQPTTFTLDLNGSTVWSLSSATGIAALASSMTLQFGTHTASPPSAFGDFSGYITVKDAGGTVRKLVVMA